jgi:hypothetical protein
MEKCKPMANSCAACGGAANRWPGDPVAGAFLKRRVTGSSTRFPNPFQNDDDQPGAHRSGDEGHMAAVESNEARWGG